MIYLIGMGEPLPVNNNRLQRMGHLFEFLISVKKVKVKWITSNFDHYSKEFISTNDKNILLLKSSSYYKNQSIKRIISHWTFSLNLLIHLFFNIKKNDTVLISSVPPEIGLIVFIVKLFKKFDYVVDLRDLWPDVFIESKMSKLKKIFLSVYFNLLNKIMFSHTKKMISPSKGYLNYFNKKYKLNLPNEEIYFTYINSDRILQKNNYKNLNIVFCGSVNDYFDFNHILKVAKNFRDLNLHIIGMGKSITEIQKFKIDNNLHNIYLHGYLNHKQINEIMKQMHIGIAPYRNIKNFNLNITNKIVEYLSFGLPVLTSCSNYQKEFIEKNNLGFSYHDYNSLNLKIAELSNTNFRNEISQNCYDFFDNNMNYEKGMEKIFKSLIH